MNSVLNSGGTEIFYFLGAIKFNSRMLLAPTEDKRFLFTNHLRSRGADLKSAFVTIAFQNMDESDLRLVLLLTTL